MSNHSGSYMLNALLERLEQEKFFQTIGPEKTKAFMKDVLELGERNDCNHGEILEGLGSQWGLCYCCEQWSSPGTFQGDTCAKCSQHFPNER